MSNKRHTRTADDSLPDDFFNRFSETPKCTQEVELKPLPASFLDSALESKSVLLHTADIVNNDLESPLCSILLSASVILAGNV